MDNYQYVALLIDEMIDEGIVINTDSESLENKVYLREPKTSTESSSGGGYFKSVKKLKFLINNYKLNLFNLYIVILKCKKHTFERNQLLEI